MLVIEYAEIIESTLILIESEIVNVINDISLIQYIIEINSVFPLLMNHFAERIE